MVLKLCTTCRCALFTVWVRLSVQFAFLIFLLAPDIENTRWVSFDIKLTRQGFENACWHREACRAIQHAFSKPSLVNLISKDANLVFYFSVYPLLNTLQTSDYDVILMFVLIQRHMRRHSKGTTSSCLSYWSEYSQRQVYTYQKETQGMFIVCSKPLLLFKEFSKIF